MKIKNIKKFNNKILQLQILKLYYKKKSYNFKTNIKLTECYLNKISNLIYNYHIHGKKILFLGFPQNFKKLLQNTNHILISEYSWINGMLSNKNLNTKKRLNTFGYKYKLMSQLQSKLDLIIVYNLNPKNTAIKESQIARIPTITVNTNLFTPNKQATYESPENFNIINDKIPNNNFFLSIIKTDIKKALKTEKIN